MATAGDIRNRVSAALLDPSNQMFPVADILNYINYALLDITTETRSLIKEIPIAKVKDKTEYALPSDFLSIHAALYNDSAWRVLQRTNTKSILFQRYSGTSGTPAGYDVFRNIQEVRASGTAASGGTAEKLIDASVDPWSAALVTVGDRVKNTTDSSELIVAGAITYNGSEVTFAESLVGGAGNTFAEGDSYEILKPSSSRMALSIQPAAGADDAVGTESIVVIYAASHRTITEADITNANDDLELDPELVTPLITRAVYYGTVEQQGLVDPDVTQLETRFRHEMRIAYPQVQDRISDYVNLWTTGINVYRPKFNLDAATAYPRKSVTIL